MKGANPKTVNRVCLTNNNSDSATVPVIDAVVKGTHDMPWVGTTFTNLPELNTQGPVA